MFHAGPRLTHDLLRRSTECDEGDRRTNRPATWHAPHVDARSGRRTTTHAPSRPLRINAPATHTHTSPRLAQRMEPSVPRAPRPVTLLIRIKITRPPISQIHHGVCRTVPTRFALSPIRLLRYQLQCISKLSLGIPRGLTDAHGLTRTSHSTAARATLIYWCLRAGMLAQGAGIPSMSNERWRGAAFDSNEVLANMGAIASTRARNFRATQT